MREEMAAEFGAATARLLRARSTVAQRRADMKVILARCLGDADLIAAVLACEWEINGCLVGGSND